MILLMTCHVMKVQATAAGAEAMLRSIMVLLLPDKRKVCVYDSICIYCSILLYV